jgi:hypothetical protein
LKLIFALALPVLFIASARSNAPGLPHLAEPLHIVEINSYQDGGTVSVVLEDANRTQLVCCFDGRVQSSAAALPEPPHAMQHMFIGATHPSRPEARSLPLWGSEERQLVKLLDHALADSLSRPAFFSKDSGYCLVCDLLPALEFRRNMHEALDRGDLASVEWAIGYFSLVPPIRADNLTFDDADRIFTLTIVDAKGEKLEVRIPEDTNSEHARPCASTVFMPKWSLPERYLITLASRMVDDSAPRDSIVPLTVVETAEAVKLHAKATIDRRKCWIRAFDSEN